MESGRQGSTLGGRTTSQCPPQRTSFGVYVYVYVYILVVPSSCGQEKRLNRFSVSRVLGKVSVDVVSFLLVFSPRGCKCPSSIHQRQEGQTRQLVFVAVTNSLLICIYMYIRRQCFLFTVDSSVLDRLLLVHDRKYTTVQRSKQCGKKDNMQSLTEIHPRCLLPCC